MPKSLETLVHGSGDGTPRCTPAMAAPPVLGCRPAMAAPMASHGFAAATDAGVGPRGRDYLRRHSRDTGTRSSLRSRRRCSRSPSASLAHPPRKCDESCTCTCTCTCNMHMHMHTPRGSVTSGRGALLRGGACPRLRPGAPCPPAFAARVMHMHMHMHMHRTLPRSLAWPSGVRPASIALLLADWCHRRASRRASR